MAASEQAERKNISISDVKALKPGETQWDKKAVGFGIRRQRSEAVTFFLQYRTLAGRQRWMTIGQFGSPWTPESARKEAQRLLGEVANGNDPAADKHARKTAVTVSDLLDHYWADCEAGRVLVRGRAKKPSTLASDKGRIEGHIRPLLGHLAVASVTRKDVENAMNAIAGGKTAKAPRKTKPRGKSVVRGGKGVATRTVGLIGAIFTYAVKERMRTDNPAHGVDKFAENKRERRLSDDEYVHLGKAITAAGVSGIWPPAVACAHFLALTGWRSGEALALKWTDIDAEGRTAVLADTKTGRSVRPLAAAALAVIETQRGGALVFRPSRGKTVMTGFGRFWDKIAALGALSADISPHVLRHSFASVAADIGYNDSTIAALLGHKGHTVTGRYTHRADKVLVATADAVAQDVLRRMDMLPAPPDRDAAQPAGDAAAIDGVALDQRHAPPT
jgi:integrase